MPEEMFDPHNLSARFIEGVQNGIFSEPIGDDSVAIRDGITRQAIRQGLLAGNTHPDIQVPVYPDVQKPAYIHPDIQDV